ncbi:uncharacterized protein [Lolium perenne]|uniref:uncharacterized protein n=1 Tax=Lolium perenne TaxID=4522 RepID=UPI0021F5DDC6|nr:uncharacterized protein LOC127296514 isoform X1 [Lolium perenne]
MPSPAAGEWTTASDSNAPPGGDSSSAWDQGPRSPVPADSLAPGRDAAGHPPRHGWPFFASDSDARPGEDSSFPVDHFKPEYFDKLAGYFVEAARRLPLAEIPYLAYCFTHRSLAIGLADPVTNILLTTIDAFAHTEPYRMMYPADIEQTRNKISFAAAARSSWVALQRFMLCYFRYLDAPEADILLHNAGFDLRVAIEAVQLHLDGAYNHSETLVPDSARTKAAFEYAAYPRCSAPHLLRLMTSSYPCCMVEPVLEDLRRGEKLTAACIYKLCELLRNPWSPPPQSGPPPPTPGTFRDSSGALSHIVCFGNGSFVTTRISKDGVATATFTASPPTYAPDFSKDATNLLSMFPIHPGRLLVSHRDFCSVTLESPDFLPFLRLQLLDMVHLVYLKAIAMLPVRALREGHLLHSLVTAGHCYGPLDPVANVVINTIWYDALFPLSKDVASKLAAADILDARSMHRIESRSIDGLVAYLCRSPSIVGEQAAVTLLCRARSDIPILDLTNMCDVAQAAKHPQPAAFGEFLERQSIPGLYQLYCHARAHEDPDSAFERIKMALVQSTRVAPVQRSAQDIDTSAALERLSINDTPALEMLSARRSSFMSKQAHRRGVLEHLLICYGYNDPLAPLYKLGVICGVTRQRNYRYTDVFHANFLASSDGGSSWKLFFAEFWNQPDNRIEESEKSFCCPIPYDHKYPGRCVVCENDSSVIIHPQSRKYYMGNSLPFPLLVHLGADTEKLDFDVIYSSEDGGGGACGMLHTFMQTFYLFPLFDLKCCDMAVHIAKTQTLLCNQ